MLLIPKIIHQIWSGIEEPLPSHFKKFGDTWKLYHPEWQYELWDNRRMNDFVQTHYPQYWDTYCRFPYNIQRWDSIRYLILEKIGGVYADFDIECFKPLDDLWEDKQCCFSLEPSVHAFRSRRSFLFNNALMASIPNHRFMKAVIDVTFQDELIMLKKMQISQKENVIMYTTGPIMLVDLYRNYPDKESIYLIPENYTSPLTREECLQYLRENRPEYLQKKLKDAYALHYFFNTWIPKLYYS